jgi:hypothetical protein
MRASMMRLLTLAVGMAMLLGGSGCSSYRYFDIDVKLDTTLSANGTSSMIQLCYVFVKNEKGGIEDDFALTRPNSTDNRCPVSGSSVGTFEYSTFKDSGSLTFSVAVYDSAGAADENCKMGEGSATVPVKETTNVAPLTVMAIGSAAGCQ